MPLDKIAKIRQKIDIADQRIITTLALRVDLIRKIANYKKLGTICETHSEAELFKKVATLAEEKNLNSQFVKNIYKQILNESKKQMKNILQK